MIGASHFFELAVATAIALSGPESGVWPSRQWGLFDPEHGYAWGTPTLCDVDVPDLSIEGLIGLGALRAAAAGC